MRHTARAAVDPLVSRSNQIAIRVGEKAIVAKLREIEAAIERKVQERKGAVHASE